MGYRGDRGARGVQINRFNSALKKRDARRGPQGQAERRRARQGAGAARRHRPVRARGRFPAADVPDDGQDGQDTDLYSSTFGAKPDLSLIVGSAGTNDELWKGQLMMA